MPRKPTEEQFGRWRLGKALMLDLEDFCEASWGAPEHRIVSAALRAFIDQRLEAEPELKKRFEEARLRRIGAHEGGNVTLLTTATKDTSS